MKNFKIALVASVVALSAAGTAMAATDGTLGTTSSGTSIVTIIKQNAVQITNVADLDLGTHATLAADQSASDPVCVFASTGGYSVTATSTNGGAGFAMVDGADSIAYAVSWSANNGPAVDLTSGTLLAGQAGNDSSLDCGGGTNAVFEATVSAADFNAANPGSYSDTLTLLINPE